MNAAAEMTGAALHNRHRQNIAASLAHRLAAARAANNTQLVELLEWEQRQLADQYEGRDPSSPALLEGLRRLWQALKTSLEEMLAAQDELRVRQWVDAGGTVWWYAQDPLTGDRLCTRSDWELMDWLEKHRWND